MKYQVFIYSMLLIARAELCFPKSIVGIKPVKSENGIDIFYDYDGVCSSNGGICVNKKGCIESFSKNISCSSIQENEIICCKNPKFKIESCEALHDTCQKNCDNGPTRFVDDCPFGTQCCVLL